MSASDIDGSNVVPEETSLSSRVDRLELLSGGDMYPAMPCVDPVTDGAEEYGGGGPEYVVGGLLNALFWNEVNPGIE